jgi:hypothetical protein
MVSKFLRQPLRSEAEFLQSRLTAAEREIVRLREAARESIGMIDNCAGAPTNPDSLPQMVRERLAREINGGRS